MTALVPLAWRLAQAGGRRRLWIIVIGNAVATALLLATAAIPGAIYAPGAVVDSAERANVWAVLTFSLLPAVVLLLTASRTSAAVRDRRLASLRLLGLSRARTALLAALENGLLGLIGALSGLVLFLVAAPVIEALVATGPGWFSSSFTTSPITAGLTVLVVALLSAAIASVSLSHSTRDPIAQRSEATIRDPSPWRLALVVIAVAVLTMLTVLAREAAWLQSNLGLALLVAGALAGAIAIAQVTPLLSAWLARVLIRSGSTSALLAGRSIQVEPGGSARLVAGVGVAVYLVLAALAVLSAFESTPQYRYALQTIRQGPQPITVGHERDANYDRVAPLSPDELVPLTTVPGVRTVVPQYGATIVGGCRPDEGCNPPQVFVGTCADLAEVMTVTGCRDDQAAVIMVDTGGTEEGWEPDLGGLEGADHAAIRFGANGPTARVELGAPLVQDSAATQERWVYQSQFNVFVPGHIADQAGARPMTAVVIADGGLDVQQAVATAAPPQLVIEPYTLYDYDAVMRVRAVITTLSAIVIGVGLLSLGMTAVDRAVERRKSVARHIAIGMPARTLRRAQLLQTLLPLAVAVLLATGLGALMVRAFAALAQWPPLADGAQLGLVATASLAGALLVSLATLPVVRTRISADLLRRE